MRCLSFAVCYRICLLALLALASNWSLAAASPAVQLRVTVDASVDHKLTPKQDDDPGLMLLEVRLDEHVLAEALTSYQVGSETFLPLGELAKLLTLGITTQPNKGTADGFVLTEARGFHLDIAHAKVILAGHIAPFNSALVRQQSDDIYVASSLLSSWLPLDIEVDLARLAVMVKPREHLPLQERLAREKSGAQAGRPGGYDNPDYPYQATPYRLLGVPFIDQTLGIGSQAGNGGRQTNINYTTYLTDDVLGMESALFLSNTRNAAVPDVRFTLARLDPAADLLGPLHARSVILGSAVLVPSLSNITSGSSSGKGFGLTVSNRPLNLPTSFDRHTLQGDLPPNWDVELYFNDALVGFQASRLDGRYSFDNQPLIYGINEFRLVFHGPLGQQRVERQSFLLEQSSTPAGAFYYNVTQYQDTSGQSRSVGQFEWGLNKYLTGTGGVAVLPAFNRSRTSNIGNSSITDVPGESISGSRFYNNLGLRASWQAYILSSDFFMAEDGGWLNENAIKTQVGPLAMSYSRTLLNHFSSEVFLPDADPLHTRDKLRVDGAIPASFLPRLPVTVEVRRDTLASGNTLLDMTGRISAYVNKTSLTNQITWQSVGSNVSASGLQQMSRQVGSIGLNAQLSYSLKPQEKIEAIAFSGNKRLGDAYLISLGLGRSVIDGHMQYTAGLNKSLGHYGLSLSTSFASNERSIDLRFFVAIGREPRQKQWGYDALPRADKGAASVRVFLDSNGNGIMDPGEEPIENVALTVNGSDALVRTNAAGIARLDHLPIRQYADIAVDTQTLEDPYWQAQHKGVRMLPRPGHDLELDFPVELTSEIDGSIFLLDKDAKRGMGDVLIELLNAEHHVVSSIKSSSDGYYIVPAVVQGHYQLRISPEQLKALDLVDPGLREITITPDGKFINGIDFLLKKQPAKSNTNS